MATWLPKYVFSAYSVSLVLENIFEKIHNADAYKLKKMMLKKTTYQKIKFYLSDPQNSNSDIQQ